MKKILLATFLLGIFLSVASQNSTLETYKVPFKRGDAQWKQYHSAKERKKALQIPDSVLKNITTEELFKVCMSYPYLPDFVSFESREMGMDALKHDFNGIRELVKRKDIMEKMLLEYEKTSKRLLKVLNKNDDEKVLFSIQCLVLRYILRDENVLKKATNAQKEILYQLALKDKETINSYPDIYYGLGEIPLDLLGDEYPKKSTKSNNFVTQNGNTWRIETRTTPKGSLVNVGILVSADYTSSQKAYFKKYVEEGYDGAEVISEATLSYNCHGYAWRMSEGEDQAWLGFFGPYINQDIYWEDGSYVEVPESLATTVSYQINHSAVRINSNTYISKWGSFPLVRHAPNNVVSNYGSPMRYYKRYDPSIIGSAFPNIYTNYQVDWLLEDCSVSWSFSGIPVGLVIAEDSPVVNRCTINNTNKQYINGTLTATITKDGAVIATPTKVLRTGANFAGTYSAASRVLMSPANTSLIIPAIATTDFADDDVLHVWAGTTVTLSSAKFQDAIVTHTGGTLASWVNNNNGTITLSFPLSSYYDSIMVTGVPNNSYETYRFKIVAMGYGGDVPIIGDDNPLSPIQLSAMGSMYSLSLSSQYVEALSQKEGAMPQWNISIVNSITGQLQYENSIKGSSTTVDATNWPTGVYAVYVKVANEVFTRKFAVK